MKKALCAVMAFSLLTVFCGGCSTDTTLDASTEHQIITLSDGTLVNDTFNTEVMTTIDGTSFLLHAAKDWFTQSQLGFGITHTPALKAGFDAGNVSGTVDSPYALSLFFIPKSVAQEVLEQGKMQNETDTHLEERAFYFAGICRLPQNDVDGEEAYANFTKTYAHIEKIAEAFGDVYYFGYNEPTTQLQLTTEEKQILDAILAERTEFCNKIFLYPSSQVPQTHFDGTFEHLDTQDMTGQVYQTDVFADYDLTIINVWATWDNPCITQMPELAKLDTVLPENVNLISICMDANENQVLAQEIMDYCNTSYPVLLPSDSLEEDVLQHITSVPTTFFVDHNGEIVGEPLVGVVGKSDEIVSVMLEEIQMRLSLIGKQ